MRLLFCALVLVASIATAQTCPLTPLTPADTLRIQEGEAATDSDAFQALQVALGGSDRIYFADATGRIRTIETGGRLRTLAGNGKRGPVQTGAALESPMPAITQVAVAPSGAVHFSAAGRLYRIDDGRIVVVAGSGRPGFNGESAEPLELNLGSINHFGFDPSGVLYLVDSFLRVRRLGADGVLRTFAGSTAPFEFGVANGDGGPATRASLQQPRQVIPLPGGAVWIRDLRALHAVAADGVIRRLRDNLDLNIEILLTPEGNPVAAAPGRLTPLDAQGQELPGTALFPGFTGNPRAIGNEGLYAINSRGDLITGLFRWRDGASTLVAAAPRRAPTPGVSTEPFGVWVEQTSSLFYRSTVDGVRGLVEARAGQAPRLIAGQGADTGDAEGKPLTALSIAGVLAFTADNEGRLLLLDVSRQRVLIVAADGTVTNLKDAAQQPVATGLFAGALNGAQRIAVDAAGNIYWALPSGVSPQGPVGRVAVWTRSSASVSSYLVVGLEGMVRLANGSVAGITGSGPFDRTLRRLEATRAGEVEIGLQGIGFESATLAGDTPYFVFPPRLFRGRPGSLEAFAGLASPAEPDRALVSTFVLATARGLILRAADGAFYRLDNPDSCSREAQPKIAEGGVVSAAGFGYPDRASPWNLLTVFGSGLGPREGQGFTLDGLASASAQPAPYPNLLLGQRTPNGSLAGFPLPVVFANDTQMTVQVPFVPGNGLVLFWPWNGLLLTYPNTIAMSTATPAIFVQGSARDGSAAALNQDGSINSAQRPAARGSVVQFFLTGLGGLQPPLANPGAFNSTTTIQRTQEPVSARVGGMPATVEFAGAAPGLIGGLYQVNVRIPAGASAGAQAIEFAVAGQATSAFQKVTIALE